MGSQLELLRQRVHDEGDELVDEFCDEGYSGARLDRPGLDAVRDAAQAGRIDTVWCLSPDRLARVYAYQVVVLDELARHGVTVRFTDAPPLSDDPQSRLLTQVQGVIAEYERAKITERYRRGKLFRSRAGEVISARVPTAIGASRAKATARPDWKSSNPRLPSCVASSTTTSPAGTPFARSRCAWPTTVCPNHKENPESGAHRPSACCCATRHTSAGCTSTEPKPCPTPAPANAQNRSPAPARTGSPSPSPPSSARTPSTPPAQSATTTANGAHAAPSPTTTCSAAWSNAAAAAFEPNHCATTKVKRPGPITTTASTTTPSKPAAATAPAPNATSTPTPSTRTSSTRSAPPYYAPTSSSPANKPSSTTPPPPTRTSSPPNWPASNAKSTPPPPNDAAWPTSTKPDCSTYPNSTGAPPTSTTATTTSNNATTPSPTNNTN